MTDMTNDPTGIEPAEGAPFEAAAAQVEPTSAPTAAKPADHVSIPKRWLLVGGGVVLGLVLLGGTFAAGVGAGSHAGRLGGRGAGVYGGQQLDRRELGENPPADGYGRQRGYHGQQGGRGGMMPGAPQGQIPAPGQ